MEVTLVRANQPRNLPMAANGAITTSAPASGTPTLKNTTNTTFQLIAAGAATVVIEVTNDQNTANGTATNWLTLATLTTSGAGTDGFSSAAAWNWVRARTTVAAAACSVLMGG